LCAKLHKCDTTLLPDDDIKIYDALKSTAVFSRIQSCLYQYLDLQGFLVGRYFVVKEFAVFKDGFKLSHYIFGSVPWSSTTKAGRCDVIENRHGIQWEDGMVPYCMARSLITKAVMSTTTTDEIVVYIKEHQKQE